MSVRSLIAVCLAGTFAASLLCIAGLKFAGWIWSGSTANAGASPWQEWAALVGEVGCAICVGVPRWRFAGLAAGLMLSAALLAASLWASLDGKPPSCGCFGAFVKAGWPLRVLVAAILVSLSAGALALTQRVDGVPEGVSA